MVTRVLLSDESFAAALNKGTALSVDTVIAKALTQSCGGSISHNTAHYGFIVTFRD
jgi:hypothetical protein